MAEHIIGSDLPTLHDLHFSWVNKHIGGIVSDLMSCKQFSLIMNITTSDNKATAFRIYVSGYQSLKRRGK